jgi:hypothetical protein
MIAADVPNGKIFRVKRNKKVFKMLHNRGRPYVTVEERPDDLRDYYLPFDEKVEVKEES